MKGTVTKRLVRRFRGMRYPLVLESALVGVFAGGVAVLYRILLTAAENGLSAVTAAARQSAAGILLWLAAVLVLAFLTAKVLQWEPMAAGSGIPQVEGEMEGALEQTWWKVICAKLVGGFLCIFAGLSLGREGPSIQLGGMAGKGVSSRFRRNRLEERFLITCGASAGLSAAFNAPLAGVMFALEEIHKNFSPLVLMSAMAASVIADFLSETVFGRHSIFAFADASNVMPLRYYGYLAVLGLLLGVCGVVYNKCLLLSQDAYQKLERFPLLRGKKLAIPFLAAGALAFVLPEVLGGGHNMIAILESGTFSLKLVFLLLLGKFLFSMLSFGSGAPGGIFFPLLVIGAYIGGAFGLSCVSLFGVPEVLVTNFIIFAMAGYFTAIVRAPITGIILICEMTGSLSHVLPLAMVSVIAYVTADVLKSKPVYESLLERILAKAGKKPAEHREKMILEMVVEQGSSAADRKISEITLPETCLILALKRGEEEMIPKGSTVVRARDVMVLMYDDDETVYTALQALVRAE